jgi:hypothetical protein
MDRIPDPDAAAAFDALSNELSLIGVDERHHGALIAWAGRLCAAVAQPAPSGPQTAEEATP